MVTKNMIFRTESNWKKRMSPDDEHQLNSLLEQTAVHRQAYIVAEEIKTAQLWCALLEMKKDNARLRDRLGKIEYLLDGFASRAASLELNKKAVIDSHERF